MDVRRRAPGLAGWAAVVCWAATGAGCAPGPIDVASLAPGSLQNSLVAHWPFDDGAGAVISDQSGNGHDGALVGGTWIADGRFGGALRFASGDQVTVASFPQATDSWTVAAWVRPPSGDFGSSYVTLLSTELLFAGGWELNAVLTPAAPLYEFGYWIGPGDSDNVFYNCSCVTVEAWTHLAAVVDSASGTLSFYTNGVLQGRSAAAHLILSGSPTLFMGRWHDDGRLFTGDLDDVAVYSRALVAAEIAQLATAPAPDPR